MVGGGPNPHPRNLGEGYQKKKKAQNNLTVLTGGLNTPCILWMGNAVSWLRWVPVLWRTHRLRNVGSIGVRTYLFLFNEMCLATSSQSVGRLMLCFGKWELECFCCGLRLYDYRFLRLPGKRSKLEFNTKYLHLMQIDRRHKLVETMQWPLKEKTE